MCYYDENSKGEHMKSTKFWITVIAVVLVVSAAASVFVMKYKVEGNVVGIYHHGALVERIHLDTVTTPYTFTIGTGTDYNIVSVERGRICVSEASCPDHVCVNTGWLSDGAVPIVCLPNELVIKVEGSGNGDVDMTVQ